jgi:SPX domain protein involved in polyphosphate accumulation
VPSFMAHYKLMHWNDQAESIFLTHIQVAINGVVPYHISKYRKIFRSVVSARKIMTTVIKDVRNVILVNSKTVPAHTEKFHCLSSYKRNN